jgi:ribonuclease HI
MPGFDYRIVSDGGSRRNGSPDSHGYGSFQLKTRTGQTDIFRRDFGRGITSNQAEYLAALEGFDTLITRIELAGGNPADFSVILYTDSRLVVDQMNGAAKVKNRRLRQIWNELVCKTAHFREARIAWAERADIVSILGH